MRVTMATRNEDGHALLAVIMLAAILMGVLASYFILSRTARTTAQSSMDSTRGYYAAEAAVNVRLNELRAIFVDYNRPSGTNPVETPGVVPCETGYPGSGDFACNTLAFSGRQVPSYVVEDAANPREIVIARGELYQNLRAQEYLYRVNAVAIEDGEHVEALVGMNVRSRLVPLFQFAVFYNKDLEILPGPSMTFAGPVHANGNLYLDAGDTLTIDGQTTAAGAIFRGRKESDVCSGGDVRVFDPAVAALLPACGANRLELFDADLAPWNGMVRRGVDPLVVPAPEVMDPVPGALYWDRAELRVMLDLNGGVPEVEVRDVTGARDDAGTTILDGCASAADQTSSMYNFREDETIRMLEIDVELLLDCLYANPALMGGKPLDDASDGGLVWYLGVDGPDSDVVNDYGVRLSNGDTIAAASMLAPDVRGLTVVTDQALYVQGHYNALDKIPAALMADSLNVLSGAWDDDTSDQALAVRAAEDTTIQAAFLAGTDTTGGPGGEGVNDGGQYNGGLENYPRFHETWAGDTLTYRGSFVSLGTPRHVDGTWGAQSYSPPIRDWGYDLDFNDAANLPPLAPRFFYIVQDLYVRDFEL